MLDWASCFRASVPVRVERHGAHGHQSEVHEGSDPPALSQVQDCCPSHEHELWGKNQNYSGCDRRDEPNRPGNLGNPDQPERNAFDRHDDPLCVSASLKDP